MRGGPMVSSLRFQNLSYASSAANASLGDAAHHGAAVE
jgi:hypothetical protein